MINLTKAFFSLVVSKIGQHRANYEMADENALLGLKFYRYYHRESYRSREGEPTYSFALVRA